MFQISKQQLLGLSELQGDSFKGRLREFLIEEFPRHTDAMGADALDDLVALVMERAGALDFDAEREFMIFAVYAVLFGAFFDDDPQYPWAGDRLARPGLDPHQRIDLFRTRAEQAITGLEEAAQERQQLEVLATMDPTTLAFERVDVNTPLVNWYAELFPAQTGWMRPRDLSALTDRAEALSQSAGLISPEGPKLVIAAMGMLGSGFAADPQHHGLSAVLKEALPAPEKTLAFAEAGRALARDWLARVRETA